MCGTASYTRHDRLCNLYLQWTIRQFPLSHPFNHPCFPWAFYPRHALRAKMATLKKSPSPPRYSRPLLHLRRRRWVDAAETAELGGLRRRGAHRPGELLMLSTVAQTSSPRHSPGRRDLKPSPHPTRVLSHPLLLGTQGVSGLVLYSCSSKLEMADNPPPLGRQDLRTNSRLE